MRQRRYTSRTADAAPKTAALLIVRGIWREAFELQDPRPEIASIEFVNLDHGEESV